jgi:hypothetical protein
MSDEKTGIIIISLIAAIGFFLCGSYFGYNKGKNDIYYQAVQKGVGEWVIQADGKPTFRFK